MALGLAYDSEAGRAFAASITALMGGHAYATSGRIAGRMGAFEGFALNAEHMIRVLGQHRDAVSSIDEDLAPVELLSAAQLAWDTAVELASSVGVRNAQATVLAPTGTISFMMDCDTTGVEPDLGLVKFKKLVGGGTMSIVNQTVPRALRRLGYNDEQRDDMVAYVHEHATMLGAPHLRAEHLDVFACSMGDNTIHQSGHLEMMGAVQPFLSGAISKTVNLPESATVEDIEELHLAAWRLGLKAVAVYRDNCKVAQPLSTGTGSTSNSEASPVVSEAEPIRSPEREPLPRQRRSRTLSFRVADCHGFMTVGEYEDGRPGEIFLTVAKQGSTLAGIMDAFAISVSHGLQYGVPLKAYVEAYTNVRFEPAGITDDPELRITTSLVDYLFRRLALEYLSYDERAALGVLATDERSEPTLPGMDTAALPTLSSQTLPLETLPLETLLSPSPASAHLPATTTPSGAGSAVSRSLSDAPMCFTCGDAMARAGSCYTCRSCGSTSGCS